MDISYELNGVLFCWDSAKAKTNLRKHDGISFELAATVFFDPFLRVEDASRNDEARDAVIGFDAESRLLYVVHIESEGESIRIISARRATRPERERYDS
jgi:hypothetical protein